jgi:Cu/Ag efflux protein CusF
MIRVPVAAFALLALFCVASFSQAAEKGEKKKTETISGTVKSVDAAAKTITLTVKKKEESEDKTLTLADKVKVNIDGEKKTLEDIKEGATVQCRMSEDGKSVTAINVGKRKKKGDA